jgi:prevent-host-death family protein
MNDVGRDIQSLTLFKRNSSGMLKRIKKTGRPLVLTVKGRAEAVVIDAAVYPGLKDRLDAVAGIRRGLAQAKKGIGRHVDDVFANLEHQG